jgi:hypothetical protein
VTDAPAAAAARLGRDAAAGYLAVAPERGVQLDGVARFAWWRVDPKSGETIGVTDEGTYGASSEYVAVVKTGPREGTTSISIYYARAMEESLLYLSPARIKALGGISLILRLLREGGWDVRFRPWP